ncbi:unnamed protein product [Scytosiphon promiscuus]
MRAPTSHALLLVLLPISHGALFSQNHYFDNVGHDSAGRMLRAPSESASLEAVKNRERKIAGSEGAWHSSHSVSNSGPGHLQLFEICYMTDDCAPGLFTEADFRTRCEITPFSSGSTICCKPFATPCDSDEACCSGNCDHRYTRCDDAIVPHTSLDQDRAPSTVSDSIETSADGMADTSPFVASDEYDGVLDDELASHDDGSFTEWSASDGEETYDELAQNDDTVYDATAGDTGDDSTFPDDPLVEENPLEDSHAPRRPSGPEDSPDEGSPNSQGDRPGNGEEKPQATRPPPHDEGDGDTSFGGGSHGDGSADVEDGGNHEESRANTTVSCEVDYSSGIIRTAASSNARVEAVGIDSQGNVFYALGTGKGEGDTIRKAAFLSAFGAGRSDGDIEQHNDTLVYTGTGVILALAVDADDNLVFTMEDAPTVSGGVFFLRMAPGGVVASRQQTDGAGHGSNSAGGGLSASAPAVALAVDLGPFLPGVAVCPITGDIYVTRGHGGVARLVKGVDGDFSTKMRWGMEDMSFNDGGKSRAPLMVWDIAVNSLGIVYFTTYVQGVVLKGIFPRLGGTAHVRLAAGKWDSGVVPSSGDGGRALSAVLLYPKGIAIDHQDSVYVAEFQGGKIRKIADTNIISTCAGTGSAAYEGDDGPASEAGFDLPNAIAFMPGTTASDMAVADFGHKAVRVITPIVSCA